jgi:hypothetical protein
MKSKQHELLHLATLLSRLAKEGHGGSEARLVGTLKWISHRLRALSRMMDRETKSASRRKYGRFVVLMYLMVGIRTILDLHFGGAG